MICRNCGNEIPDNSKFCLSCGCELMPENEYNNDSNNENKINESIEYINNESTQNNNKKSLKVSVGIFVAAILLVFGIIISIIIFSNPTDKYIALIKKGEATKATELYESKISGNNKKAERLRTELTEEITDIFDKYYDEKISYEEAAKRISIYKNAKVIAKNYNDTYKKINSLYTSRCSFEEAKKAESNNDFKTAITKYKLVIQDDKNYDSAQNSIEKLKVNYKAEKLSEAENFVENRKITEAINVLNEIKNTLGQDDEITKLLNEYKILKEEEYVTVKLTDKGVLPKNYDYYRYFDSASFVFTVKNNTQKVIKGVEGTATFNDLFGNYIISMGTDFLGKNIAPGETVTYDDLIFEVIPTNKNAAKLLATDYSDLQFEYEVETVVFTDGTSVKPD